MKVTYLSDNILLLNLFGRERKNLNTYNIFTKLYEIFQPN